jgi:hypothetical protein
MPRAISGRNYAKTPALDPRLQNRAAAAKLLFLIGVVLGAVEKRAS